MSRRQLWHGRQHWHAVCRQEREHRVVRRLLHVRHQRLQRLQADELVLERRHLVLEARNLLRLSQIRPPQQLILDAAPGSARQTPRSAHGGRPPKPREGQREGGREGGCV